MKKLGYILPAVFVFAFALTASAQKVDTHQDRGETLKVTVTGGIDFHYVFRNDDMTRAGAGGLDPGSSTNTFEGDVALRLDIELSEKINAVLSLRSQKVGDFGGPGTVALASPGDDTRGPVFVGTGKDVFNYGSNPEEIFFIVDEASVTVNELFNPGLKLSVGIVPVSFDIRGKGSAFFFDPRHSSTFAKNAGGTTGDTTLGLSDELQPAGAHLVYSKDAISLGLYLLPAIMEGGAMTDDETAYGIWFMYALESLGKGSRVGAIVSWNQLGPLFVGGNDNNVFTIGLGADIQGLVEGLELYLEIYFQFGKTNADTTARGWALQLGGEYHLPNNDNNIWFGLNFKFLSGDGDVTDERASNFLSYENINDTLILEDQWFGLDLDTNYWTIQGSIGAAFTVGSGALKNNLEASLLFGFFQLATPVFTTTDDTKNIGHELDLKVKLWASKQVSFDTAFGVLFASEVLEETIGGAGDQADKFAWLWTVGTNLKF